MGTLSWESVGLVKSYESYQIISWTWATDISAEMLIQTCKCEYQGLSTKLRVLPLYLNGAASTATLCPALYFRNDWEFSKCPEKRMEKLWRGTKHALLWKIQGEQSDQLIRCLEGDFAGPWVPTWRAETWLRRVLRFGRQSYSGSNGWRLKQGIIGVATWRL